MGTLRLLIDGDILTYKVCWAVQTVVHWDDGILTTATNVDELNEQLVALGAPITAPLNVTGMLTGVANIQAQNAMIKALG